MIFCILEGLFLFLFGLFLRLHVKHSKRVFLVVFAITGFLIRSVSDLQHDGM